MDNDGDNDNGHCDDADDHIDENYMQFFVVVVALIQTEMNARK